MPQTKFNCKGCRRLVSIESAYCPFCKTPNEHYKKMEVAQKEASEDADSSPIPVQQKKQNTSAQSSQPKPAHESKQAVPDDDEIPLKNLEAMYKRVPINSSGQTKSEADDISEKGASAHTNSSRMEEDYAEESEDTESNTDNTISSSGEVHRSPIDWEDEREKPEIEYTDMFDEKNVYQANYDGYYNDTLPKIKNEIDRALASKEKIILKGVFAVAAVIAIIVYLIITI